MSEDKSKLQLIGEIAQANNKNLELIEELNNKEEEIERLKQGYCELKEKCNKGECDCTHEEYNNMCEENIKMDLEIERLNKDNKDLQSITNIEMSKSEYLEKENERLKEELKYSIPIVEHNKTIQSNINSYNKLSDYSNELEDRIDELNNLNEKISLALESAEYRLDKAIEIYEECCKTQDFSICDLEMYEALKGVDKE